MARLAKLVHQCEFALRAGEEFIEEVLGLIGGGENLSSTAIFGKTNPFDALPIGVLHLGAKTPTLVRAGFERIGDLEDTSTDEIRNIPTLGRRIADLLTRRRIALLDASDFDGSVDWVRYCASIDIPLLPTSCHAISGGQFLQCLPTFFAEVAIRLTDQTLAEILHERICKSPIEQKTLAEIAKDAVPPITRERVRQKEKKLLKQLTGGLLNDSYDGLDIHFRPEFSYWWRLAADKLAELDEIEFNTFVEVLSGVWGVSYGAIMEHMPAILAIVTGQPQMQSEFRSASKMDPRMFGDLCGELQNLSVLKLRIGKHASTLRDSGYQSLGEIIAGLRSNGLADLGPSTANRTIEQVNQLGECISVDGVVDWQAYRHIANLDRLPETPPSSPSEFVNELKHMIEEILRLHPVTKRSVEIFDCRTSRDVEARMTLHQVAGRLGTHQPSVKREETVFLRFLHDTIIERNFCTLSIWIDETWLDYWSEAQSVFKSANHNYEQFAENLAWRWRLPKQVIGKAAPTIWAVLTGYPDKKRVGPTLKRAKTIKKETIGRIRLKGFRRIH